jgi:hypothetical protein
MDGTPSRKPAWNPKSQAERRQRPARCRLVLIAAILLSAELVAPTVLATTSSAADGRDNVAVQGGWAYTRRDHGGAAEFMATTRASEDDVWLVLGCTADERLTVSAIHATQFPFPLSIHALVQLHSRRVPSSSIAASGTQANSLFIDANPLRHILPLLIQDEQLFLTIPEPNGTLHDYTFSMQPNDVALKSIRLGCLNDINLDRDGKRE